MNPHTAEIHFPTPPVELKVRRSETSFRHDTASLFVDESVETEATTPEMVSDIDALRFCEASLIAYEQRLREWQEQLEQAGLERGTRRSSNPWMQNVTATEPTRQDAWGKVVRARELLEIEQKHLRDDRIMIQGMEQQLKERETRLTAREAQLAARETRVTARESELDQCENTKATKRAGKRPVAALKALNRNPFALAKSVFGA